MIPKRVMAFLGIVLIVGALFSCKAEKERQLTQKAQEIHERVLTVDTHCDTPLLMIRRDWDMGVRHDPEADPRGMIDLPRMKEGGLDAEFFAVFIGQGKCTQEGYRKARERADELFGAIHEMCEQYPDMVELATTPDDASRLEKEGKIAAFIGLENGYPIGKDLSLVKEYYDRGMRYITLCHSSDNQICGSSTDKENPEKDGLSELGKKVVAECNRLGIMVDVSHISDKSFFEVMELTKAPVIASHSSVRALCDHSRNLSDEMLEALAENGGTIQICFVSSFIKESEPNPQREKALADLREKYGPYGEIQEEELKEKVRKEYRAIFEKYPRALATLDDLVDHIDYVVDKIGVDHVGIGTDFDGGGGVKGCDDVTEVPYITQELINRGYSEKDIQKIWGGNLMRVFREVIEAAE